MLTDWLSVTAHEEFLSCRARRCAFAQAGVAIHATSLLDWDRLDHVLRHPLAPDVLVTRDGALVEACAPRSTIALRALLDDGCGIVVRRAQRHDASICALAEQLGKQLAGTVQVQLFITPEKTRGFTWHYDREDVIILQTLGSKTYYLRENTVVACAAAAPDFARIREEASPLQACTLFPGDMLYLPSGMWHMGRADSTAFSISLGVTSERSEGAA